MPDWVALGICKWLAWLLRMQRPGEQLTKQSILDASSKVTQIQEDICDQLEMVSPPLLSR